MLHVHRSERADALVDALRAILADPPADPFATEVVAVPTRGMERWLTQQSAAYLGASPGRQDGICANVDFPSPRRLVAAAVAAASGVDPDTDPWRPERAVWPLLEVIDACRAEPWLAPLNTHLCAGGDAPLRARRFAAARHLAGLYDRYATNRPALLRGWAAGEDGGWQAELWRRLAAALPEPDPASRVDDACARVREEPELVELPARFALVGLTRLPPAELAILRALATHRDVHLFLLHPSPALWEQVGAVAAGPVRRDKDPTARLPTHPLLASWGRDSREMQLPLAAEPFADHHHPADPPPDTLLGRIQAGVHADRAPADPPPLDPADDSLRIHSCHGRARQVEVVRDAVLHLLREDPDLEPRDVIVMCPDIEAFAPLIHATFGAGEAGDEDAEPLPDGVRPPDLRVRLADRSLRQTNAVLGLVAQLVDLAGQRLTASQVLDVADREPVRRRFGFDDDDVSRLESWVTDAGIRWGLDAAHRAPFKLDKVDDGTWEKGLDRLLLGVTMPEEGRGLWSGVLPLDDVESGAIDLAGRFAEFLARLGAALDALGTPKPVAAWATALAEAADALTATPPREAWPRTELQYLLDDLVEEATRGGAPSGVELSLPELRVLLADRLAGRPTRANFRTGHLTVCTLMPMRSVPHRVVVLLGMDDGVFPRKAPRDGDDLLLDDPQVGDRDARTEDRQLLLDALLAAREKLVVTYTGNDERTNEERPPAVPVGELLDVVDRSATVEDGHVRDRVLVRHPLQPFDPRNFAPGALGGTTPWSFDRVTLAGAAALGAEREDPPPFLPAPLPAEPLTVVELRQLVAFVEHPVRAFLRERLEIRVRDEDDELDDALPVELDGLAKWGVGDRLLRADLEGIPAADAQAAERARGALPPEKLAEPVLAEVRPGVEAIAAAARSALGEWAPRSLDARVRLAGGRIVNGTVAGVCGDVLATVTYSRVRAKQRIAAWVRLLALTAARPERPWSAVTIGRDRGPASVLVATIPALGDTPEARRTAAEAELETLLGLFDAGMREPLPLFCETSAAYAAAVRAGDDPRKAAAKEWDTNFAPFDREDRHLEHQLVLGGVVPFTRLMALRETDFDRFALELWTGLLRAEAVSRA